MDNSQHTPGPLDINATIVGPVVELRYPSHGEAVRQLYLLRERLAQREALLEALKGLACALDNGVWGQVPDTLIEHELRAALAAATGSTHE